MSSDNPIKSLIIPPSSPWQRKERFVPKGDFGKGLTKDFSWFFKGKSTVSAKSHTDVCRFLSNCKYIKDELLFMEEDFWQHPITFEHMRKGDCEDHALWAWRKLAEIGYDSEFVSGVWLIRENGRVREEGHAWVLFKKKGNFHWQVLETTEKNRKTMIMSIEEAKKIYKPHVAVDASFKTYRFASSETRL